MLRPSAVVQASDGVVHLRDVAAGHALCAMGRTATVCDVVEHHARPITVRTEDGYTLCCGANSLLRTSTSWIAARDARGRGVRMEPYFARTRTCGDDLMLMDDVLIEGVRALRTGEDMVEGGLLVRSSDDARVQRMLLALGIRSMRVRRGGIVVRDMHGRAYARTIGTLRDITDVALEAYAHVRDEIVDARAMAAIARGIAMQRFDDAWYAEEQRTALRAIRELESLALAGELSVNDVRALVAHISLLPVRDLLERNALVVLLRAQHEHWTSRVVSAEREKNAVHEVLLRVVGCDVVAEGFVVKGG